MKLNVIVERKPVEKPLVKIALKKAVLNETFYFCIAGGGLMYLPSAFALVFPATEKQKS